MRRAVTNLFHHYLNQDHKVGDVWGAILGDSIVESAEDEETICSILLPLTISLFAETYVAVSDDTDDDINQVFESFCSHENINLDLQNALAEVINEVSAAYNPDEADDDDFVFSPDDWQNLSAEERMRKVRAFILALGNTPNDVRDMRPFVKHLDVGSEPDFYGNKQGASQTKTFDREKHRYGHRPVYYDTGQNDKALRLSRVPVVTRQEQKSLPQTKIQEGLATNTDHGKNGTPPSLDECQSTTGTRQ
jgi:hypothetical protein